MSSLLRPVGRLPASAYWVRRVLVLAVLTALVVVLFRLFDDDPRPTAAPGPVESPSVQPNQSAPPSPSAGASVRPSTSSTPSSPGTPDGTSSRPTTPVRDDDGRCSGGEIRIVVAPAARTAPAGRPLNLQVRMSAIASTCTASIEAGRLVVAITSGRDRIWTTAHCARTVAPATVVLSARRESTTTIGWDGRRSQPRCAAGQPAKAGTYLVVGRYAGRNSEPQTFRLT